MQGLVQLLCQSGVAASATQAILDDRAAACVPCPLHAVASTAGAPWPSSCSNGRSLLGLFMLLVRLLVPRAAIRTRRYCVALRKFVSGTRYAPAVHQPARSLSAHGGHAKCIAVKWRGNHSRGNPSVLGWICGRLWPALKTGVQALEQRSGLAAQRGVGVLCRLLAVSPLSDADCRAGIRGPHFRPGPRQPAAPARPAPGARRSLDDGPVAERSC